MLNLTMERWWMQLKFIGHHKFNPLFIGGLIVCCFVSFSAGPIRLNFKSSNLNSINKENVIATGIPSHVDLKHLYGYLISFTTVDIKTDRNLVAVKLAIWRKDDLNNIELYFLQDGVEIAKALEVSPPQGSIWNILSVATKDLNQDGYNDIILIGNYIPGVGGQTSEIPFGRVILQKEHLVFEVDEELSDGLDLEFLKSQDEILDYIYRYYKN